MAAGFNAETIKNLIGDMREDRISLKKLVLSDEIKAGLLVWVHKNGKVVFEFKGKEIGRYPEMSVDDARAAYDKIQSS